MRGFSHSDGLYLFMEFQFSQKQKFTSLKLELMKRFIGSHDETIECKIAVSEKAEGRRAEIRTDERR